MIRAATCQWQGNLHDGVGALSTESETLKAVPFSFNSRFGSEPHTNPEELLGAAHASCFTMAFVAEIVKRKMVPDSVQTSAEVVFAQFQGSWKITEVRLHTVAVVPGATDELIQQCALIAKNNCPMSKVINAKISLDARLRTQLQEAG